MKEEKKEIKIIKLKNRYLYYINIYRPEEYLMNGKALEATFKAYWYVIEEEPRILQRKETIEINKKWELKNKELYNETIPLIVDEHTQDKYKSLINSDLYKYTYDEKEILKDIELEVISYQEINEDIPFDYEEIVETSEGWYINKKTKYLIERVTYSIQDNCLIPSPIKELTRPCILPKKILYEILVDYILRNIDKNVAKVTSNYGFCIRIENVQTNRRIIEWENDYDGRYTLKDLYANNFTELVSKLENMKEDVIKYINQRHVCEHCNGSGFSDKELNLKKYYSVEKI